MKEKVDLMTKTRLIKQSLYVCLISVLSVAEIAEATSLTIPDYSFELPPPTANSGSLDNQIYSTNEPWHASGGIGAQIFIQTLGVNNYQTAPGTPSVLPSPAGGTQYLQMNITDSNGNSYPGRCWQDLGPLEPNTIYTLNVAYGQDLSGVDNGNGAVSLINGENPFEEIRSLATTQFDSANMTPGTFSNATVVITTGYKVSGDITVLMEGNSGTELDFDNVRLDATAAPQTATALTPMVSPTNYVLAGQSVTLSEVPAGQAPFTYQWLSDSGTGGVTFTPISGANSTNYVVNTSSLTSGSSMEYEVEVTNDLGNSTSAPVTVNILPPQAPSLVRDTLPASGDGNGSSATVGGTITYSAIFSGSPPISYQWEYVDTNGNSSEIPGATNSTLTITNVQLSDTGFYYVEASNALGGPVLSSLAQFNATPPIQTNGLVISTANQFGFGGQTVFTPSWKVTAGSLIADELPSSYDTNGSFEFGGCGGLPALTDGRYGALWPAGTASSDLASCGHPVNGASSFVVYSLPSNTNGYNVTNIVVYGGWSDSGRDSQSYNVWYSTVTAPTNFVKLGTVQYDPTTSLTPSDQSATRVSLISTNGILAHNVAFIKFDFSTPQENGWQGYADLQVFGEPASTIAAPPVVVNDTFPTSGSDVVGGEVVFNAAFSSYGPVSYQWLLNGGSGPIPIPGATNTTLTLTNLQLADSGSYSLQASNAAGVTVSTPSPFVVNPTPVADTNGVLIATANQTGPSGFLFTPTWTSAPGLAAGSLITGELPVLAITDNGSFHQSGAGGIPVLTDGQFGYVGLGNNTTLCTCGAGGSGNAGGVLIYQLTNSVTGDNLTNIVVYGGWSDNGRDQQAYTIYYSTVADPTNFVKLDSVSYLPASGAVPNATRVSLTSATGAALATNVGEVMFDFTTPSGENGWEGYSEIQLFGGASPAISIPAPALAQDINPVVGSDVVGSRVTFTAQFNSTSPITYQWQKDGTNITGATGPTLTINNLQLADSGLYDVVATTGTGTAASSTNSFTVNPAPTPDASGNLIYTAYQAGNPSFAFTPTWAVAPNSLIAGELPSSISPGTSAFTGGGAGGVPVLTDGQFGSLGLDGVFSSLATCGTGQGEQVVYTLPGSISGFDLTHIVVFGGWQDSGRDQQAYTVYYATAANPTTFVKLDSISYLPGGAAVPNATRVIIASASGAALATNAVAVKFDFTNPSGENGWEGYSDIQLFGNASAAPAIPTINEVQVLNGNLIMTGTGGQAGGSYIWLTSTNVAAPLSQWKTNSTGVFDATGGFSNAIPVSVSEPSRYFRLKTP